MDEFWAEISESVDKMYVYPLLTMEEGRKVEGGKGGEGEEEGGDSFQITLHSIGKVPCPLGSQG